MAARDSVDVVGLVREQLEGVSPDLLQAMVKTFAEALMSAEADAVCEAAYGQRSPDRVSSRNGYRPREWDTRAGTIELAIPKLRQGSYFPGWLLRHRRRAEQALVSVVATSYLLGVSTRRAGEAGRAAGGRLAVQQPGVGDGCASGRAGAGVSQPTVGRRAVRVRVGRRAGDQMP